MVDKNCSKCGTQEEINKRLIKVSFIGGGRVLITLYIIYPPEKGLFSFYWVPGIVQIVGTEANMI